MATDLAICSYLVIPVEGAGAALAAGLEAVPGCEIVRAENREVFILVTDTPGPAEEAALRARIEALPGIGTLILTFGQLDPGDP
jgi:nitrate reductase NapAB chaperone NapD